MAKLTARRAAVRIRQTVVFIFTVLALFALIGRLAWIQIVHADEYCERAWNQWNRNVPVTTFRGSIYDRHHRLLAGSTTARTVGAIPPQVTDAARTAEALSSFLQSDAERLESLMRLDRSAVYLERKVDEATAEEVRKMNLEGIIFFNEEKRYYPGGELGSQLLGFMGMDQGWGGLEVYYEDNLRGDRGIVFFSTDARGRRLPNFFTRYTLPREGHHLHLGVDESIQHIVEKELDRIVEETVPRQALAIVVDPWSGAVLAAASRPTFHPEEFASYDAELWKLAPMTSSFEPGSTFKLVTMAAYLEEGLYDPHETHHCPGYKIVNGRRIGCWTISRGGHGNLTYHQALASSCNPAFMEMGARLGAEKLFSYIDAFGFGKRTGIDYPGESGGLVFHTSAVGPLELATTTFGQGVSVTPLQQTMALAAMVNGGYLFQPYLVEEITDGRGEVVFRREPEVVRQVISRETSRRLVEMMEDVVLEGTGRAAAVPGYRVGGKTGTAQKLGPEGFYLDGINIYSFAGFAPVEDPRIVVFVAVDEVTEGPRYGSHTSGPLFRRITEQVLHYLQVPPCFREEVSIGPGEEEDVVDAPLPLDEPGEDLVEGLGGEAEAESGDGQFPALNGPEDEDSGGGAAEGD